MRKSSFEVTLGAFYSNMEMDIKFLVKVQEAKQVVKSLREKREVFEAYVFKICANWEIFSEVLLIDCLNKDTTRYREFTGFKIPINISRETCKAIILGTGYLDFKSVSDLKRQARQVLVSQYNPFKEILGPNGEKIDEFFTIRNYLAHYSDAAKRSLEKIYRDRYSLRSFREPGEFLLAKDREERLPRMGVYIDNFIDTAEIMEKFLGVDLS